MIHLSSRNSWIHFIPTNTFGYTYSAVIWIYCIKEAIYNPTNRKERGSHLTRRAENTFVLYSCKPSQRIKIFCHILLWIMSRISFLNTGFRESMRNWKVSQFQRILLRSSTIRIWNTFLDVIKQHMESKDLNILIIWLILLKKISSLLHYSLALQPHKTLSWPVTHRKCPALGKTQIYQCFHVVPPDVSHEWSAMADDTSDSCHWGLRSALLGLTQLLLFAHKSHKDLVTVREFGLQWKYKPHGNSKGNTSH